MGAEVGTANAFQLLTRSARENEAGGRAYAVETKPHSATVYNRLLSWRLSLSRLQQEDCRSIIDGDCRRYRR